MVAVKIADPVGLRYGQTLIVRQINGQAWIFRVVRLVLWLHCLLPDSITDSCQLSGKVGVISGIRTSHQLAARVPANFRQMAARRLLNPIYNMRLAASTATLAIKVVRQNFALVSRNAA